MIVFYDYDLPYTLVYGSNFEGLIFRQKSGIKQHRSNNF